MAGRCAHVAQASFAALALFVGIRKWEQANACIAADYATFIFFVAWVCYMFVIGKECLVLKGDRPAIVSRFSIGWDQWFAKPLTFVWSRLAGDNGWVAGKTQSAGQQMRLISPCGKSPMSATDAADSEGLARSIVKRYTPTQIDEVIAQRVAIQTKACLSGLIPEAEIQVFPVGNCQTWSDAGGLPQFDVNVSIADELLVERLAWYFTRTGHNRRRVALQSLRNTASLHKTATKTLYELMRFVKLWRTQVSGPECKLVLIVSQSQGIFHQPILLNLTVNCPYPSRMKLLLGQDFPRRAELILLVTHWARERCVCNVQKGQFALYTWCTLVVYFYKHKLETCAAQKSILECFQDFVEFYADWFAVDPAPDPVPVVGFSENVQNPVFKRVLGIPYIEDSLAAANDLAAHANADGLYAVYGELQRARDILSSDDSRKLEILLRRPWRGDDSCTGDAVFRHWRHTEG